MGLGVLHSYMMLLYEFEGEELNLITTAFFCDNGSLGRRERVREIISMLTKKECVGLGSVK